LPRIGRNGFFDPHFQRAVTRSSLLPVELPLGEGAFGKEFFVLT
jgi:hypothetical protein